MMINLFEATVRRGLEFDPDTQAKLRQLDGNTLEVELTGLNRSLYFQVTDGELKVFSELETRPDLKIIGSPFAFARYVLSPDRGEINNSGIKIEGDVGLAQQFANIISNLDIDWEEWASQYVGDVVAYRSGRILADLQSWARHSKEQARMDVREFLQEESRLLAPKVRVERFMNEVDELRSDVERLAQRLQRLHSSG